MVSQDPIHSFDSFLDSVTQMQDAVSKFQLESLRLPDDFSSPDKDSIHNSDIDKLTIFDESFSSSDAESFDEDTKQDSRTHDTNLEWLKSQLSKFSITTSMNGDEIYSTVLSILTSDSPDEELQSSLPDILGYDNLELVIELISRRNEIQQSVSIYSFFIFNFLD